LGYANLFENIFKAHSLQIGSTVAWMIIN